MNILKCLLFLENDFLQGFLLKDNVWRLVDKKEKPTEEDILGWWANALSFNSDMEILDICIISSVPANIFSFENSSDIIVKESIWNQNMINEWIETNYENGVTNVCYKKNDDIWHVIITSKSFNKEKSKEYYIHINSSDDVFVKNENIQWNPSELIKEEMEVTTDKSPEQNYAITQAEKLYKYYNARSNEYKGKTKK